MEGELTCKGSRDANLTDADKNRAVACDVICLEAVVLLGGKTMEYSYGNRRKFALFSLTSPALVIEHLQY